MSAPGFAEREQAARAAWESFALRDAGEMTHDFRGGYHRGRIDGSVKVTDEMIRAANDAYFERLRMKRIYSLLGAGDVYRDDMRAALEAALAIPRE